jgi:hypothetical protein
MQDRVRTGGPQLLASAFERSDRPRKQIEASLGRTAAAGRWRWRRRPVEDDARASGSGAAAGAPAGSVLSLDGAGTAFTVLCGKVEPDDSLGSQVVMGGAALGDEDEEGFSGYVRRCFAAEQAAALSEFLNRRSRAGRTPRCARHVAARHLSGMETFDLKQLMDAFRACVISTLTLRKGQAVVTCLV